ncbi:hypothetical protein [Segatella buccae]|uniref:hypothetical protein n=1 Tax=Segatella buccae TaxID=28126 RepID=UPI0027BACCF5|nr:hypothetical protein [Segatella buccae]
MQRLLFGCCRSSLSSSFLIGLIINTYHLSPITHHPSPNTHHPSPITHHLTPITHHLTNGK